MVGDIWGLGQGLEHKPLILPPLYRTVVFSVWVGVFRVLEATVSGLLHRRDAVLMTSPHTPISCSCTLLNRATGDSYTYAAILVCASAAICSTAAVTSGA